LGRFQFDYLVARGLQPHHRLLDLGCGCLRGGVHFVRYLEPGHYYGLDVNASLLDAGFEVELPRAGLAGRLPRENLLQNGRFEAWRWDVAFDFVLAQSVFTHLPPAEITACLAELASAVAPGGQFFATCFEAPEGERLEELSHEPGGIVSYAGRDPFHYRRSDLQALVGSTAWRLEFLGSCGHPRDQRMLRYVRP